MRISRIGGSDGKRALPANGNRYDEREERYWEDLCTEVRSFLTPCYLTRWIHIQGRASGSSCKHVGPGHHVKDQARDENKRALQRHRACSEMLIHSYLGNQGRGLNVRQVIDWYQAAKKSGGIPSLHWLRVDPDCKSIFNAIHAHEPQIPMPERKS